MVLLSAFISLRRDRLHRLLHSRFSALSIHPAYSLDGLPRRKKSRQEE